MKKITIFIVLATLCLIPKLQAQTPLPLSGQLHSPNGTPLSGATLLIQDTKLRTTTDESGNFSFPNAPAAGILSVSYTGYIAQNIPFNGDNRNLRLLLNSKENDLEEVQINAGYYSVKDKVRTGSIAKVSASTLSRQPVSNPLAALQGRVAGLTITQRNGLPGSEFNVQIRGRGSIQSGTSPLYLVNGVPFISESLAQNSSLGANSPLNSINPNDIESIEVLKDADATAIYGSRGANGVILITTKKGKAGTTTADINLSSGFGQITRAAELMNTAEFLSMRKEAFANDKANPTLANAPDLLAWDTGRYSDYKDLLIGGTARSQNAQLRLSGGSPQTSYSFSANYYKETTVYPGEDNLQRKDASLNLNHHSSDNRFNLNLSTSYGINTSALSNIELSGALSLAPNSPNLYDASGKLNWSENGISFANPLAKTLETNRFKTDRFSANAVIGYQLLKNLELKTTAGFNSIAVNQYSNVPISAQNPATAPTGQASFADNLNQTWIVEPQINYSFSFPDAAKFSLLLGASWQGSTNTGSTVRGTGYTSDLLLGSIESAATKVPANTFGEYQYQAVFARLNYNLKDRYLLNLTARRDGSSRFGTGRQFANFGALGAAWVFTEENFLKSIPAISFGKIRVSYGITGNDQINNYQYLDSYTSTLPYGGQTGLIPNKLFNENYGWEENRKTEVALELGFFKDRIRINAGWFNNLSSNQLISYSLPAQTGFPSILLNLDAKIRNRGVEFDLSSTNVKTKDFSWSTSANLSLIKNKLLAFPDLERSSYASTYVIGQPLSLIRGYHYTGINPSTGAYAFEDKNGDGLINSADFHNIGTKDPSFYGGIENTFQYKSISLNIFFQFVRQKGTDMVFGSYNLIGSSVNAPKALLDRWTPENPNAKYQAYSQSSSGPISQARLMIPTSDAALVDASFIRLKNLALSYQLPKALIQRAHLKTARIYIQGQNLLTFSPYLNLDPESQNISALPPLKMVSLGLQITL